MKIFGVLVLRCFVSIVAQIKPLCPATTERVWPDAGCPLGRLNPEEAQGTEPATCRDRATLRVSASRGWRSWRRLPSARSRAEQSAVTPSGRLPMAVVVF